MPCLGSGREGKNRVSRDPSGPAVRTARPGRALKETEWGSLKWEDLEKQNSLTPTHTQHCHTRFYTRSLNNKVTRGGGPQSSSHLSLLGPMRGRGMSCSDPATGSKVPGGIFLPNPTRGRRASCIQSGFALATSWPVEPNQVNQCPLHTPYPIVDLSSESGSKWGGGPSPWVSDGAGAGI